MNSTDCLECGSPGERRSLSSDVDNRSQACGIIVDKLCAGLTLGFGPSAAERFEDQRRQARRLDAALHKAIFRIETHALRVEHGQKVVRAELESLPREIGGGARRARRQFQMTETRP